MSKKIIIVGGVAGGATAAARLRRLDETATIIMLERGEHISFANCGLPYYIGGPIPDRRDLLVQTVKGMSDRYKLDIRIKSEVSRINRDEKYVEIINLDSGKSYTESYDYLILSPGANPIVPPLNGLKDNPAVYTLRTIPDADRILSAITENGAKSAVIIGGGFVGLEVAENLIERNLAVTLVEATNQVQPAIDYEMACLLHAHLRSNGVNLLLEERLTGVRGNTAVLHSGKEVQADIIVVAIGVVPENNLAVEAGLATGERGAIRVNEYLQTSDSFIYAIGDAIEVSDYILKKPTYIPLAWPANRQGRLVADNICGNLKAYRGSLGTSVAKIFDLTVSSAGMNEKLLKRHGISYKVVHIHPNSHAGYYPGASPITLKLIFSDEGRILGAQAIGKKGVDKRIDVIATAIKGSLTVYDLQDLELAYAPPYSSAKDPVNMAGYAAGNMLDGLVKTVQYHEIDKIVADGNLLIDVRQPNEVALGKIPGSINIPLPQLRQHIAELPKDKPIYISCQVGLRGYLAARILMQHGFDVYNLDGGYRTYASVYTDRTDARDSLGKCTVEIDDSGKAVMHCPS